MALSPLALYPIRLVLTTDLVWALSREDRILHSLYSNAPAGGTGENSYATDVDAEFVIARADQREKAFAAGGGFSRGHYIILLTADQIAEVVADENTSVIVDVLDSQGRKVHSIRVSFATATSRGGPVTSTLTEYGLADARPVLFTELAAGDFFTIGIRDGNGRHYLYQATEDVSSAGNGTAARTSAHLTLEEKTGAPTIFYFGPDMIVYKILDKPITDGLSVLA